MNNFLKPSVLLLLFVVAGAASVHGQGIPLKSTADPDDVSTPEAIVAAAYASISRATGEQHDWARFQTLVIPQAKLIPNLEQTGGQFMVMSTQEFIDWANALTQVGTENDQGFVETGIKNIVEQYGDIAHVFSTYEARFWGQEEAFGGGINSFQLVNNGGRWWIVGIVWDEPGGAGPIPEKYMN